MKLFDFLIKRSGFDQGPASLNLLLFFRFCTNVKKKKKNFWGKNIFFCLVFFLQIRYKFLNIEEPKNIKF